MSVSRRWVRRLIVSLAATALLQTSPRPLLAQGGNVVASPRNAEQVVRRFIDAYNRHDVPALLALADTGIVWLSVEGDSVRAETRGRAALGNALDGYFRQFPTARSTLEAVTVLGPWVTARERAEWTAPNGPRSQASLSVYEVRDGRVRRVWYYPVVR